MSRRSVFACLALFICLLCLGGALGPAIFFFSQWRVAPNKDAALPPVELEKTPSAIQLAEMDERVAIFDGRELSPCYFDHKSKTLYRWQGVTLRRDQVLHAGPQARIPVLNAKDFSVVIVEPPIRYREAEGKYRAGFLQSSYRAFYEFRGIVLTKADLLKKSSDGQDPLLDTDALKKIDPFVIEIELPDFLKNQPRLWKKN